MQSFGIVFLQWPQQEQPRGLQHRQAHGTRFLREGVGLSVGRTQRGPPTKIEEQGQRFSRLLIGPLRRSSLLVEPVREYKTPLSAIFPVPSSAACGVTRPRGASRVRALRQGAGARAPKRRRHGPPVNFRNRERQSAAYIRISLARLRESRDAVWLERTRLHRVVRAVGAGQGGRSLPDSPMEETGFEPEVPAREGWVPLAEWEPSQRRQQAAETVPYLRGPSVSNPNPVGFPQPLPSKAWIRRDFVWSLGRRSRGRGPRHSGSAPP